MDKVDCSWQQQTVILIEFFKCDLKMTLLYFVRDVICFTPLLTQKQNLYTWKHLLHVYVCVPVNLDTSWFDQLVLNDKL